MGTIAVGVVLGGLATSMVFTRVAGGKIREQARKAEQLEDLDALPEQ